MIMGDVVGLSSLNVDYIYETEALSFLEPFYPPGGKRREWVLTDPAEVRAIKGLLQTKTRLVSKTGGGSGANTVYCLAKMGFQSGIVGKIGKDEDADFLIDELNPIPFQHLARGRRTGNALIVLGPNRDRIILLIPNANRSLKWSDLDLDFFRSFSSVHMTSLLGEGLRLQERLAEEIYGKVRISFDPGEVYCQKGLTLLTPLLSRSEILFITEKELEILTGFSMEKAVPVILETGVGVIAVKRKGAGASIYQDTQRWHLKAEIIKAQDTTGAGDVFAAGFLAGMTRGQPIPICGRLGLVMAHQSMKGLGREAYPHREDFKRALDALTK
jgi:sugar/nucleoside kinase (ribokinase family)